LSVDLPISVANLFFNLILIKTLKVVGTMKSKANHEPTETLTDSQNLSTYNFDGKVRKYTNRLRFKFLTPIIVTLSFAVLVIVATVYFHEYQTIDGDIVQLQSSTINLYQNSIQQNAKALQIVMDVLKTDRELTSALAAQDRKKLLQRFAPVYEDINRHYGVTHFYFSGPDRVNLLRVHKPEKYGDTINRQTTLMAQKDGAEVYGVELGPLGTLTLRYVQPWYEEQTQKLLGFVELGMEVDQTFNAIQDLFGLHLFLLINKQYLNQSDWEDGMRTFGRVPDWERFPQTVLSVYGDQLLPETLSARILEIDFNNFESASKVKLGLNNQHAIFQPLQDVSGQFVGTMVMLIDTSILAKQIRETVIIGTVIMVIAATILILFFYWFVGRIGKRMACNELQLQKIATQDGLTGLYNRRQFDMMLEDTIVLCTRYDRPVSLFMVDIDHFKQINDTYGHPAGDAVLVELGKRLTNQARTSDLLFRYGGEEFTVLVQETDSAAASILAQRICETIANEQWDLGNGTQISMTVSIGIASYPDHASTSQTLLAAADKALYEAKQTGRNRIYNYGDITQ